MSEYFTVPDDVGAGNRGRSAKINEIIQAVEDGFDALPAGLPATTAEIIAARDGESNLLAKQDDQDSDISALETEVQNARKGETNLETEIDSLQSQITSLVVGTWVPYIRKTTNFTAEVNKKYIVGAGLTVTLPAAPSAYDQIWFSPLEDISVSNTTIGRNGKKFMGYSEDMEWDETAPFSIVYDSTLGDWRFA